MTSRDESSAGTLLVPPAPSLISLSSEGAFVLAGRYEVQALLGVGGMGAVYRARDLELDEVVALKMLRRELVDVPGVLERFRQEVKLARKVTSPHVARTFDIGDHDGEKFLTMELVDGTSLADELRSGGEMSVARVLHIAAEICSGLRAAHAASVVHRDLKPDNVLLGRDGTVKITDFGIATAYADSAAARAMSGTPDYMAPEQVTVEPDIDARADIYAFGVVLYEMLTDKLPWKGNSALTLAKARLLAPPPNVRELRSDVAPELADLILRCMARERDDRPKDAAEVATMIAELKERSAASAPLAARFSPQSRSRPNKTVAVLPVQNRTGSESEYFADGLTDDLIDSLSMVQGLRVRARGAVMKFKGPDRDPRLIGQELGVDVFVDGSLRVDNGLLRVTVRLVNVHDGFQLWARRFERPSSDFFAVSEEVAQAITNALDVEVVIKPGVARDPVVIDLYLRARHAYFAFDAAGTARAVTLFEQALALAPGDPLILAGAAVAHLAFISMHPEFGEDFRRAVVVAEQAVACAPELADGHVALAQLRLHEGRDVDAVRQAKLAVASAPSNAEARFLMGLFFAETGNTDEAMAELEIVQSLDPRLSIALAEQARVLALLGQWDFAEATLGRAKGETGGSLFVYWGNLMRFAMWEGSSTRIDKLIAAGKTLSDAGDPGVAHMFGVLERDKSSAFEADVDRWRTLPNSKRRLAFFAQLKAEIASYRGLYGPALEALVAADELGLTDLLWLDRCSLLDPMRGEPEFIEVRSHIVARAEAIAAAIR